VPSRPTPSRSLRDGDMSEPVLRRRRAAAGEGDLFTTSAAGSKLPHDAMHQGTHSRTVATSKGHIDLSYR